MQAVYHLEMDDLTINFLELLKKQFSSAKVDIVIREMDETDYLNSSQKNRENLEKAISEVDNMKLINKNYKELNL